MLNNELLKHIRKSSGMNQRTFAEELGITQAYICMLEKGKRDIKFDLAYKIMKLAKKHGVKTRIDHLRPE
jgi:DNA-binding XRE family transcriptional regulator